MEATEVVCAWAGPETLRAGCWCTRKRPARPGLKKEREGIFGPERQKMGERNKNSLLFLFQGQGQLKWKHGFDFQTQDKHHNNI